MTRDDAIAAAEATLALARRHFATSFVADGPEEMSLTHLDGMLGRMREPSMSFGKLNRWLGWMQAAAVAGSGGRITLADMKEINRPKVTRIKGVTAGEELEDRILGTLDDYANLAPEDGESWESWFHAAFDMAKEQVEPMLAELVRLADLALPEASDGIAAARPPPSRLVLPVWEEKAAAMRETTNLIQRQTAPVFYAPTARRRYLTLTAAATAEARARMNRKHPYDPGERDVDGRQIGPSWHWRDNARLVCIFARYERLMQRAARRIVPTLPAEGCDSVAAARPLGIGQREEGGCRDA